MEYHQSRFILKLQQDDKFQSLWVKKALQQSYLYLKVKEYSVTAS